LPSGVVRADSLPVGWGRARIDHDVITAAERTVLVRSVALGVCIVGVVFFGAAASGNVAVGKTGAFDLTFPLVTGCAFAALAVTALVMRLRALEARDHLSATLGYAAHLIQQCRFGRVIPPASVSSAAVDFRADGDVLIAGVLAYTGGREEFVTVLMRQGAEARWHATQVSPETWASFPDTEGLD